MYRTHEELLQDTAIRRIITLTFGDNADEYSVLKLGGILNPTMQSTDSVIHSICLAGKDATEDNYTIYKYGGESVYSAMIHGIHEASHYKMPPTCKDDIDNCYSYYAALLNKLGIPHVDELYRCTSYYQLSCTVNMYLDAWESGTYIGTPMEIVRTFGTAGVIHAFATGSKNMYDYVASPNTDSLEKARLYYDAILRSFSISSCNDLLHCDSVDSMHNLFITYLSIYWNVATRQQDCQLSRDYIDDLAADSVYNALRRGDKNPNEYDHMPHTNNDSDAWGYYEQLSRRLGVYKEDMYNECSDMREMHTVFMAALKGSGGETPRSYIDGFEVLGSLVHRRLLASDAIFDASIVACITDRLSVRDLDDRELVATNIAKIMHLVGLSNVPNTYTNVNSSQARILMQQCFDTKTDTEQTVYLNYLYAIALELSINDEQLMAITKILLSCLRE